MPIIGIFHSCRYWAESREPRNCCSHGASVLVEEAGSKRKKYIYQVVTAVMEKNRAGCKDSSEREKVVLF